MARDPTARGKLDPVDLRPLPNLARISIGRAASARPGTTLHPSTGAPSGVDILGKRRAEPNRIRFRQVNLIRHAVQRESYGLDIARHGAVEIVDQLNKNLLSHLDAPSDVESDQPMQLRSTLATNSTLRHVAPATH
jgi:hypothetical protein